MKLDFEYLKKEILTSKVKSEYKQSSIIILRNIFKEAETKQLAIPVVVDWLPFIAENYSRFSELAEKDTLTLKFDCGTEINHKEKYPNTIMTHFAEKK